MTNREHFKLILEQRSDRCGFWHGMPHEESKAALYTHFNVKSGVELGQKLNDTFNWICVDLYKDAFDLSQGDFFTHCEDAKEVDSFPWPDIKHCRFDDAEKAVDASLTRGQAILSGTWGHFFHILAGYFGMENYFIKMHTDPDVVLAVTEHVANFFLQVNERWFDIIGDRMDALFFGNDFGSQLDLLISPKMFDTFVMPYFRRFTQQAKNRGYKVVLHSCGAIDKVIPRLIDAGVDALHPIQAKARDMDAQTLAKKYNGKIVFIGGVDTQELLPFKSPYEVREEVKRLKDLFGPNFIVSPSHEALLPNVPPMNIEAMADEAFK
jgi:uroporphyrinogen decarboxylase